VEIFGQRRHRLTPTLLAEELDAILVSNPINVSYLTNFSGDSSYLILTRNRTLLVSDARFTSQIKEECPGLDFHIRPTGQNIQQAAAEVLQKLGMRSVGFESSHLTVVEWETLRELAPAMNWKGLKDRVERLRIIKDPCEVEEICEAVHFAERAFHAFQAMLRPVDTEKDLSDRLEDYIRRFGGRCSSFPSIVAAGDRAALPHAPPTQRTIGEADLVLVDWGASGRFYKSDLTRILVTRTNSAFSHPGGESKLHEIYGVVLRAQQAALAHIRPGAQAKDIDAVARKVIADAGYGEFFGHGLGHGIGLEIHEAPALRPNSETTLQAGMVVTVEPGIYIPEWGGIRIEDDVVVTPGGCDILTSVTKDLDELTCDF
jgi:Xaa-Pro aminopeptidase